MLALEVEYLLGRVMAARHDDRCAVEWPPHPARLFSALLAAFEESDLADDANPKHKAAEEALHWFESQKAPRLFADPPQTSAWARDVCEQFVPRNDVNEQLTAKGKRHPGITREIPLGRARADQRWFPAFTPADPVVRFVWPDAEPTETQRHGLAALTERVSYLGHSMSPVRVAIAEFIPATNLWPDEAGDISLRTLGEGRLDHLREIHALRLRNSAIQPRLGRVTTYAVASGMETEVPRSLFARWLAFRRVDGPRLPLESAVGLLEQVRRAILDRYPDPLPEWVSGHTESGGRSLRPHLAIIPLPDVGHRHTDGHPLGFALIAPSDIPDEEWAALEDALYGFDTLLLGKTGEWRITPVTGSGRQAVALRAGTWRAAADIWASVTPVVFGHYPKTRPDKDALAVLRTACADIGLPSPVEAHYGPVSAHLGAPRASDFSRPKQAQGKLMAHVWLRFEKPVRGPLLIGAGRFAGFGLLKPWRAGERR